MKQFIASQLLVVVALLVASSHGTSAQGDKPHAVEQNLAGKLAVGGQATTSNPLRELLQQRLAALTEFCKLVEREYKDHETGIEQLHQAHVGVLFAQLDLALTKEDRIRIHKEIVQQAEEFSSVVARKLSFTEASAKDVLKAKCQLLEAQIALERAKIAP